MLEHSRTILEGALSYITDQTTFDVTKESFIKYYTLRGKTPEDAQALLACSESKMWEDLYTIRELPTPPFHQCALSPAYLGVVAFDSDVVSGYFVSNTRVNLLNSISESEIIEREIARFHAEDVKNFTREAVLAC